VLETTLGDGPSRGPASDPGLVRGHGGAAVDDARRHHLSREIGSRVFVLLGRRVLVLFRVLAQLRLPRRKLLRQLSGLHALRDLRG
jgi:hypothetical protein